MTAPTLPGRHPWSPLAPLWLTGAAGLALLLILAGYVAASGSLQIRVQLLGVNLGLAALVLEVAAAVAWTTQGYRAVRLRQQAVVLAVGSSTVGWTRAEPEPAVVATAVTSDRVVVAGGTVHHDATCPLAVGKVVVERAGRAVAGRAACRLCGP